MSPPRWLSAAVRCLPADRAEWGAAMMAELDDQIDFAKSKPHGAPPGNAFGQRVREVYGQPRLGEFAAAQR